MDQPVDAEISRWDQAYGGEGILLGELLCDAHVEGGGAALLFDGPSGTEGCPARTIGSARRDWRTP